MTTKQAIEILKRQRAKLDQPNDETWIFQTASFIKDFFGEKSVEFDMISNFNFDKYIISMWLLDPNHQNVLKIINTAKNILDSCIETLQVKGLYKPTNFLTTLSDTALWTIIPFVVIAVFSGGLLVGQYFSDIKNIELRQQLQKCNDNSSITIPTFPNTNPITDTIKNKSSDTTKK